jgi:hypothetical protein
VKKPSKDSIQKATKRFVKKHSLAKLRTKPDFQDISQEEYDLLVTNLEKFSIIILESYIAVNNSNI